MPGVPKVLGVPKVPEVPKVPGGLSAGYLRRRAVKAPATWLNSSPGTLRTLGTIGTLDALGTLAALATQSLQ